MLTAEEAFKLEHRYAVFKFSDFEKYAAREGQAMLRILDAIAAGRAADGKAPLTVVVIEQDWPEFTPVCQMLADRVNAGNGAAV